MSPEMNSYKTKRLCDIIGAVVGLILLSPIYLIIFLGLKLTCKGPAFFVQERIGKGGKPFNIYKFRTMIVNNENNGVPLLTEADDERLTTFGKWLRSHHLDELPQLWNVVKGDMSFVGYRPERQYFIDQIMALRPDYSELYQIRPGITSEATIHNGYTNTMEKMIRRLDMDLAYLHNQSISTDAKIVAETLLSIITARKKK